jgi:D-arabinose 1-dehydrogenase-like Zn-dependent alcohol dehydrogenase
LPDALSYADGAQVACGFGTVYEGLEKIGVCGSDAVLVTGLGTGRLGGASAQQGDGGVADDRTDVSEVRMKIALDLGLADHVIKAGPDAAAQVRARTGGHGVERAVDCSASDKGRLTAIQATRKWGRIVFIRRRRHGELSPSPDIIHDQKTIYGSWVTSIWRMEELVERARPLGDPSR